MNRQTPLVVPVGRAIEKLVLFLFIVSLSLLPQLMFARTASCPCKNPCPCGANCTCGGGGKTGGPKTGSGKTDSKHREEKKGERGHGGGGVGISANIDLGRIGHRDPDKFDPFAVSAGSSTTTIRHAKKTENDKKVAKRKEVGKTEHVTDPTIDLTQDIAEHGSLIWFSCPTTELGLSGHVTLVQTNLGFRSVFDQYSTRFSLADPADLLHLPLDRSPSLFDIAPPPLPPTPVFW
jgi:hypothetical protein